MLLWALKMCLVDTMMAGLWSLWWDPVDWGHRTCKRDGVRYNGHWRLVYVRIISLNISERRFRHGL